MKTVIAVKRIGKTPKGGEVSLPANQARALVALGLAAYKVAAPPPPPPKREYKRRDMVAETPKVQPATAPEDPVQRFLYAQTKRAEDGKA